MATTQTQNRAERNATTPLEEFKSRLREGHPVKASVFAILHRIPKDKRIGSSLSVEEERIAGTESGKVQQMILHELLVTEIRKGTNATIPVQDIVDSLSGKHDYIKVQLAITALSNRGHITFERYPSGNDAIHLTYEGRAMLADLRLTEA